MNKPLLLGMVLVAALLSYVSIYTSLLPHSQQTAAVADALGSGTSTSNTASCSYTWSANLSQGETSPDVLALQEFLNRNPATQIAASGPGSPGQETSYFGLATKRALIAFQNQNASTVLTPAGLTQGTGFFGSLTRAQFNATCNGGSTTNTTANPTTSTTVTTTTTTPAPTTSNSSGFTNTLPLSCANLTANLSEGATNSSSGGAVAELQTFLSTQGLLSSDDIQGSNLFGAKTQAAVMSFQQAHGIEATGFVGPQTRAEIEALSCSPTSIPTLPGSQSSSGGVIQSSGNSGGGEGGGGGTSAPVATSGGGGEGGGGGGGTSAPVTTPPSGGGGGSGGGSTPTTPIAPIVLPSITAFSAAPVSVSAGTSATLAWVTTNASSVSINNGVGSVSTSGTAPVAPTATTLYVLTAVGNGATTTSQATVTVTPAVVPPTILAPSNLTYHTNPALYTVGIGVSNSPTISGGTVVSYSVTPALPAGLTLATSSGLISGTPTLATAQNTYTVTAHNSAGTASASVVITVQAPAPTPATITSFIANSASITAGNAVTLSWTTVNATSVSISGGVGAVAVSGSKSVSPAVTTTYTLTAIGGGVTTTATVTVSVIAAPPTVVAPSNLTYQLNPAVYTTGTAVSNSPSSGGGAVISYSVTPALPLGLTLASTTGLISGTPTTVTAQRTYTVTAQNSAGNTSVFMVITVQAPVVVAPPTSSYVTAILRDSPLVLYRFNDTSGTQAADSSGNSHPAAYNGTVSLAHSGLLSNDSTDKSVAFSGGYATEQTTWSQQAVSVEAWINPTSADVNQFGGPRLIDNGWSDTSGKGFELYINHGKPQFNASYYAATGPTSLVAGQTYHLVGTYSPSTGTTLYVNGTQVANTPQGGFAANVQTGDSATTYFAAFNPTAGIGGFYTGSMSDAAIYNYALTSAQVAAHYTAGSGNAPSVPPVIAAPSNLTYQQNPALYTVGTAVSNAPSVGGGAVVSYSVSPALPAGLSLNTTSGLISGTPTSAIAQQPYTVTAQNTGGSTPASLLITVQAAAVTTPPVTPPSNPSTPGAITYNAQNACINGNVYTNNVLPAGVGEFSTNGLNTTYWGATKTRTQPVNGNPGGSWGPGFLASWGRHQYDTYFSDPSDGLGLNPFFVGPDTGAPGSPTALRIEAAPLPASVAKSVTVLANDQYVVTSASAPFKIPTEGGSLTVNVANPNSAQNNWSVGMGYADGAVMFVGTLTSGGATPSGNGTGGSNPWTISNIHVYSGTPGATITPGSNDEGGLRSYNFPDYYSGVLDTNINQQYGYFTARVRLPNYLPGLSPAFWTLETGGVPAINGSLNRDELDIEEMFGNTEGNALNANQILWQQNSTPEGKGVYPFPSGETPQSDYHDYGVLITPSGTSFYLDGNPIPGDTNLPDGTQGSPDKELMLMFQVGSPGNWLDPNKQEVNNPWPQYFWAQWIRVYQPTATSC